MTAFTSVAAILLVLLPAMWSAAGAPGGVPALPPVAIDEFPPGVRDRVAAALRHAQGHPDSAAATGELGMLLHAYEQTAAAALAYERARALDPAAFEWTYLAGLLHLRSGRPLEALPALRQAVRSRPSSVAARVRLGEALLAASQVDDAARLYRDLLREDPQLPQARYGLGRALAALGQLEAAVGLYRSAVEVFPDYGAARYALGLALRDLGRDEEARESLATYPRHAMGTPPLPDPLWHRVRLLAASGASEALDEGVRLSRSGDLEGAIRSHERALQAEPALVQAHANLIGLFAQLGRWEKADEHYRAAIGLSPEMAEIHYNYGRALLAQGRRASAGEALKRALAANPLHARAHDALATILEAEGRLAEAEAHYRQAIANEVGFREARFNLGRVLLAQARPREAVAQFERIVEPDDAETPRYLFALAAAHARAGNRGQAIAYAEQARRRAETRGQTALAASVARDLERLRALPDR